MRQQFTGQQRDSETSLDYFNARYYSSTQGRFTSVDPLMASASVTNPQSLNRYSYVQNSPTIGTDPSGMMEHGDIDDWSGPSHGGNSCDGQPCLYMGQDPKHLKDMPPPPPMPMPDTMPSQIINSDGTLVVKPLGIADEPIPSGPPTPTPSGRDLSSGFGRAIIRLLPRKLGRTLGAQALFASGDQVTGGTVSTFVTHDFFNNSNIAGVSYGGGTHSMEEGYGGIMASAGVGDGYLISNAKDDELKGNAQALMGSALFFGVEFDWSHGKDGFVYTVTVSGGKSIGGGFIYMPVRTVTTGDLNKIATPK